MEKRVFVSVGRTSTEAQEDFVRAIEDRLRAEGFTPCTVGRNTWVNGAPLKGVMDLMDKCVGAVVIALERKYFPKGIESRGPREQTLKEIRLPTPFNQVEAAMAYTHGHPLLMIVEAGLREEGLLEEGNDWFVQRVSVSREALSTPEFNGVFASWKEQVLSERPRTPLKSPSHMTLADWVGALSPAQLWGIFGALLALVLGSFSFGAWLGRGAPLPRTSKAVPIAELACGGCLLSHQTARQPSASLSGPYLIRPPG
jgi:hypothetical protein